MVATGRIAIGTDPVLSGLRDLSWELDDPLSLSHKLAQYLSEMGGYPMSRRVDPGREHLARIARRYSTATVLYHHAVAERLGLGPSDHKCLDLLLQHGELTGSRLAALTGLTTGAVTGVVNRLEAAGFLHRRPDPSDGRRQLLQPVPERIEEVAAVFAEDAPDLDRLTAGMTRDQVDAVLTFLSRATEELEECAARLRARALLVGTRRATGRAPTHPERAEEEAR
ncbi:MarR family winged helix-turn-helix transcriptional regulator [Geodermatophilus sp. URMC 61]|uniref:MarR family winged helix-turn-helix transcriptional regulator n=1 Tax=Geodermatophilus sp. URMC 61 TaxID=3423411 RepID=UPI00406CF1BA